MLKQFFEFERHQTTMWREILAGVTTFLTMSYILVVQPSVLSQDFAGNPTGLEAGAVLLATALSAGLATIAMGLYARLPFALAPGMGQNFFFVSVIMSLSAAGVASPWQAALGIVLLAGVLFFVSTIVGIRQLILDALSPSMRSAIAVGIGLFIAFIGLKNAGVVADAPSLVALNAAELASVDALVFWTGLLTTMLLTVARVPGGILIGIVVSAAVALLTRQIEVTQVFGWPEYEQLAAFQLDLRTAFTSSGLVFVAVFLFMDIFDTTGTLVGVSAQAGLLDEQGNLPQIRPAMCVDSMGTILGASLGTSTVTTFIESAAGVEQGGRTGVTAITAGLLFLASLAVSPLVLAIGGYPPITAGTLVVVGAMMFRSVGRVDWQDETESIPAFLVILGIPLFFSIADGIALGLIVWPFLKLARGQAQQVSLTAWLLSLILLAYFFVVRVAV